MSTSEPVSTSEPKPEPKPELQSLRLDKTTFLAPARSRLTWGYWIGGFIFLAGGLWSWKQHQPIEVKVQTVGLWYPSQSLTSLNASGYVVAQRKAAISSKATGRLQWLGVTEGDHVKTGQVIAKLDSRDVEATLQANEAQAQAQQAQIAGAEAEVLEAQRNYQRTKSLVDEHFMSQASLEQARGRLDRALSAKASAQKQAESARSTVKAAAVNVDYTTIRAPFDGIVLTKQANIGDIVTPFSSAADSKGAVVTMADLSSLEVEADVSESSINTIYVNQPCEITLDAFPDSRFEGYISRIVPTVDRSKATVMTKVRFMSPPSHLLPEMSAKVSFLTTPIPKNSVPVKAVAEAAIDRSGENPVIWVVHPSGGVNASDILAHAEAIPVRLGALHDGKYLIEGTVKVGDTVVLNPTPALKQAKTVRVLP